MNISAFDQCANCGACFNICPKGAISIDKNTLFYTPIVDTDRCVDCGACVRVCPVNQEFECVSPLSAYAGWHKEENVVLNSSSGGAFYGLAQYILSKGGVVFGAVYSEDCKTVEFASTDEVPLSKLLKSKYVESLIGTAFKQIKAELEKGRCVLFCGTPCQVAGLKCFLHKDYEQLLTCDFVCGGLPSQKIYRDYLHHLESKYHSTVKSVDFRPKTYGWKRYAAGVTFENRKVYDQLGVEDEYLRSFLHGKYTVRDYCLDCKFSDHHMSDMTIADFWLHKQMSDLEHEDGISLILCNTDKGKQTFQIVKDQYICKDIDVVQASYNHKKTQTTEQNREKRAAFLRVYEEKGLSYAYKCFFSSSLKSKIRNRISRMIHRQRRRKK